MKNNSQLFDEYLNGTLNQSEKTAFEDRIETDTLFDSEFKVHQLLIKGIVESGKSELKKRLADHEAKISSRTLNQYLYFRIAAGIALIMILSFIVVKYATSTDYEEVYAQNFSTYPNVIDPINRSESNSDYSIYQLYELKQFNKVIIQLESKINRSSLSDSEWFYLGQSYMTQDNFTEAVTCLKKITKNSDFHQAAEWYTALAFIKIKEVKKARLILNQIINLRGDYAVRAKEVKNLL